MKFTDLPAKMQNDTVLEYYKQLKRKRVVFFLKRLFDLLFSLTLIIVLSPLIIFLAILIKLTSKGRVLYLQERVTKNYQVFKIYKFRTMVNGADKQGSEVTNFNDIRITKIGKFLRKVRLDEVPQLFNVLKGEMSFVGPRPEVVRYVQKYTDEMYATLLVKAGITSPASIKYKNEDQLLINSTNVDETYVNEILPEKMKYNYTYLNKVSLIYDFYIMIRTVL